MSLPEIRRARAVCGPCPVRARCLGDALDTGEAWGIWGGYSRPERSRAMALLGDVGAVLIALEGGTLRVPGSFPSAWIELEPFALDDLVRV